MYRTKYINFNLVAFFVRDLCGGETYLVNNPRIICIFNNTTATSAL